MPSNTTQQIIDTLKRSNHILLTAPALPAAIPASPSLDGLSAGLGLSRFLERLGKKTDLVVKGFSPVPHLSFLPKLETVKSELIGWQKFVIELDVAKTKIKEMKYSLKDNALKIFITPENGRFNTDNLQARNQNLKYDLIITLDAPDLNSLGDTFKKNTELFQRVPIINIDHKSENEHFGAINLVDMTCSATSEVIYEHLETWPENFFDEDSATCFLTGLIVKTQSFQNIKSPKTFQTAGRLVSLGAQREKIMQGLFRNRSLSTFRFWGTILAHLKHDGSSRLAWAVLTARDFLETGGKEEELPGVAENLVLNSQETDAFLILYEKPGQTEIRGLLFSPKFRSDLLLSLPWSSDDRFGFKRFFLTEKNLMDAEKEVVDVLKKRLYTISTRG